MDITEESLNCPHCGNEIIVSVPTVDEFIEAYGNDNKQKKGSQELSRADILAKTYGLTVEKQDNNYVFRND